MEYVNARSVQVEVGDKVYIYGDCTVLCEVAGVLPAFREVVVRYASIGSTQYVPIQNLFFVRKPNTPTLPPANLHVATTPSEIPKSTVHLLVAGKVDVEDVTILGFYKEFPGFLSISVKDVGIDTGGVHFKALARALGVTTEVLESYHICKELIRSTRCFGCYPTTTSERTGWARLVSIKDGVAYTVSNAYNF